MAESNQDLQSLLDICQTEVASLGLRFNTKKSAVVCLAGGNTDAATLTLGGEPLAARNDYRWPCFAHGHLRAPIQVAVSPCFAAGDFPRLRWRAQHSHRR
ncbi:hypothetical protein HPB52_015380 [Rhipicephalus sanguineus]|uniref:Uncharacterized protein n=1 Tax=Rhipicephalus sanguineus TaxID=34632 RepID=A0A9D4TAK4_RHISA|nr:hypothetical protein HPB52_015380 [Rhipicephalus sanguineus]